MYDGRIRVRINKKKHGVWEQGGRHEREPSQDRLQYMCFGENCEVRNVTMGFKENYKKWHYSSNSVMCQTWMWNVAQQ